MSNSTVNSLINVFPKFDLSKIQYNDNWKPETELQYPKAVDWMWNYCVYIGTYKIDNTIYDIGFYMYDDGSISAAIVYGNQGGDYISGSARGSDDYYGKLYTLMIELGFTDRQLGR